MQCLEFPAMEWWSPLSLFLSLCVVCLQRTLYIYIMATTEGDTTLWKHIGLHGHSVGTFACEAGGIKWKSAMFGRDDNVTSGASRSIPRDTIVNAQWTVFGRSAHLRIQTSPTSKLQHELRFDGFPPTDFDTLKDVFKDKFGLELTKYNMSAAGTQFGLSRMSGKKLTFRHCILEDADEEGEEFEPREGEEMLSLDLGDVSQCVLPGNNRNEIELQFPESDAVEANNDQLVSIRFYIPPDPEADPADRTFKSSAELLQQRIMSTANIRKTTGDVIVEFDHDKGSFLTPRGRYSIELYDRYFRMRGQKYDYKIKYDDISRLFLLPKPDDVHMAFVIALDKPIRQGQQRYQHLVLQTSKDPDEVTVNMDEETLKKEYGDDLQQVMRGSLSNLVAKTFKVIAKKKVFIPGKFSNANQQSCVKCALRANEGLLYPLEKQFVFIHKPPVLIRFNEVENIEFQRYAGGQGSTRNFDLAVFLKASATVGDAKQEYLFSGIDRSDYTGLYTFLSSKNMNIKNLEESVMDPVATAPVYNEDEIYGGPDEGMEEESEDESYDAKAAAKDDEGSGSESEDIDDEDLGSEIDDALDSDLEEARKGKSKKKRKPADDDDDVDDDDDDVDDGDESPKKKKKKKSKAAPKAAPKDNSPKKAAKKPKKDPNAPKKPMSNYMLFMNANRARIKEKNPDASFGDLARLVAAEFKEMSGEEKKKYDGLAEEAREKYKDQMKDYVPPKGMSASGTPVKKGGKVAKKKKDPNAPKRGKTSFMYFSTEMRAKIKEENPDATFGEMGKLTGQKFKALTPEEKLKYEALGAKDSERYKKEMAAYKSKGKKEEPDDSDGVDEDQGGDSDDDSDDSD